jgi:hypothetical protein
VYHSSPCSFVAYQPPANITFLLEQTNLQQSDNSTFLSEQISTSHKPPAKGTCCMTGLIKSYCNGTSPYVVRHRQSGRGRDIPRPSPAGTTTGRGRNGKGKQSKGDGWPPGQRAKQTQNRRLYGVKRAATFLDDDGRRTDVLRLGPFRRSLLPMGHGTGVGRVLMQLLPHACKRAMHLPAASQPSSWSAPGASVRGGKRREGGRKE